MAHGAACSMNRDRLTLDDLAADPSKAATLPPDVARTLWVRGHVALGALAPVIAVPAHSITGGTAEEDHLLTVDDAAAKLCVTKDWLYRRAKSLPFTIRPSPGKLRFSLRGIERYIRQRQGR